MPDFAEKHSPLEVLAAQSALGDYKHVVVNMYGVDGNAFSIMGRVQSTLRKAGAPSIVLDAFFAAATEGSYEDLLRTCKELVTIVHIQPEPSPTDAFGAFESLGGGVDYAC